MLRLHDNYWGQIRKHFPEAHIPDTHTSCKPVPPRAVVEAVPCILNTGAQRYPLPQRYPNCKTVYRRLQQCFKREVLCEILA
jgi:transposase